MDNNNLYFTQHYKIPKEELPTVGEVFERVYAALAEKGYDPVNQIVGYIMSGDPTYITSHNNARGVIAKVERDDLIEEAVRFYITNKLKK
ncbi:MAG: IreB family regulatory phosphoprotein [Lachnospiraceae bacterium]|nr:IreB family regulatory phosphoprotein [Lachnospiraceae bacterium]